MTTKVTRLAPVVVAVTVSDRTCDAVLGVPWRSLRAFCAERKIPIGRIGRRPVVRVADVLAALDGDASAWSEADVVAAAASPMRGQS